MKKLLPSITLAFASLAGFAGFASAGGTFGLFTGCHCCKSCGGTITLRQYNAFSPAACGSMMFQGCVVAPPPAQPNYGYGGDFGGGYIGGGCADGSCAALPGQQMPMAYQGGYYYPQAAYTYAPAMQMPQMAQMPAMQQMPQMQMPVAPVNVTQPISARMP